MRSISVLLLTALLSSSCSWLGPEPELVCGPYDSDPDRCDAVLTVAAQAFPDAVRLEILDRETPQLNGAWRVYVEATYESGVTQTLVRFYWTVGGWTGGTDFTIAPGEGVYLKVVSTFTWTPALITPEVS